MYKKIDTGVGYNLKTYYMLHIFSAVDEQNGLTLHQDPHLHLPPPASPGLPDTPSPIPEISEPLPSCSHTTSSPLNLNLGNDIIISNRTPGT